MTGTRTRTKIFKVRSRSSPIGEFKNGNYNTYTYIQVARMTFCFFKSGSQTKQLGRTCHRTLTGHDVKQLHSGSITEEAKGMVSLQLFKATIFYLGLDLCEILSREKKHCGRPTKSARSGNSDIVGTTNLSKQAGMWMSQAMFTTFFLMDVTHRSLDTFPIGPVVAAQLIV